MKKKTNGFLWLTATPFFVLIIGFLFLPFIAMIISSFKKNGEAGFSLFNYTEVFTNKFYLQAIGNSVLISFTASLIGILVAVFVAYSFTKFSPKVQERLLLLANMTSNFAGVPLAFAYIVLLGTSGLFTILFNELSIGFLQGFNLYSWFGLVIIYIYFQIPLAIMLLYPIYLGIEKRWKEAATLLGASPLQFWLKIGIPFILPGIAGTFSILFANAMGAYATAYALVGSNFNLLPIRIGALISGDIFAQPELGSALAVFLGVSMIIALLINEWLMRLVRRDLA
ncbi:ABC transporter permease subunit [Fictibacillus nanhaiensis]|uniref:ABC transporter permease subunit n=1 Tax=Fictibacillus nanhaiensis TaxID=742169 RepID=A0ABS2ZUX7_9BACL|nr:ABC transporter permease subunit [Fictibacillus nanhaiensis]